MIRPAAALFAAGLLLAAPAARGQATLRITVPEDHPASRTIYVAGSFNGWNPAHPSYALQEQPDGTYAITLPMGTRGTIDFKFTVGSWTYSEVDARGSEVGNRTFTVPWTGTAEYTGSVSAWRLLTWPLLGSTASSSVSVMSYDFIIPELWRRRRIFVYLPPDYETSGKNYPVLYALDGEFLFDGTIIPSYGEMNMDEMLDELQSGGDYGVIVVGIDFDPGTRFREYHPWVNNQVGGGEGDEYLAFIANTLNSYVDAHYRTMAGRETTGFLGMSSGGLLATYAALKRPDIFGRVLAFSPSLFFNPEIYDLAYGTPPPDEPVRLGFLSGASETSEWAPPDGIATGQTAMVDTLEAAGYDMSNIRSEIRSPSEHALWFWEDHFEEMYLWLMEGALASATEPVDQPAAAGFDVYPNPGGAVLNVRVGAPNPRSSAEVYDLLGRRVPAEPLRPGDNSLDTGRLPTGLYVIRVGTETRTWVKS